MPIHRLSSQAFYLKRLPIIQQKRVRAKKRQELIRFLDERQKTREAAWDKLMSYLDRKMSQVRNQNAVRILSPKELTRISLLACTPNRFDDSERKSAAQLVNDFIGRQKDQDLPILHDLSQTAIGKADLALRRILHQHEAYN